MAFATNLTLPSESAVRWASAQNQQAQADTTRAELDQGLIPLKADLLRAQAENAGAMTGYHRAQTEGQGILNEEARIKADMAARERAAAIEMAQQLQDLNAGKRNAPPVAQNTTGAALLPQYGPTPAGQPMPTQQGAPAQQAPMAQGASIVQPAQPEMAAAAAPVAPGHSAEDDISTFLVKNSALGGMDNYFSDEAVALRMNTLIKHGVPMNRVMDIVNSTVTQRNKFLEDHAKLRNDLATGEKTAEEVQAKRLEMKREKAYEVYQMMIPTLPDGSKNGAYDPSKALAAGQGYGFKSPQEVINYAQQSPRFNEQQKVGVDTFNAVSQDRRRADETKNEQLRIGVSRAELAVHQGQLGLNQAKEAHLIAQDAYSSARIIDRAHMVKEDVKTLRDAIASGGLEKGLTGGVVVALNSLEPGVRANVVKYFGNDIDGGQLQVTDAMIKRLKAALTEVEVSDLRMGGQRGVATTDKSMELATAALLGPMDLITNPKAVLNGLDFAMKYTDNVINAQSKRLNSANAALEKVGKGTYPPASTSYEPSKTETKTDKGPVPIPGTQPQALPKGWSVTTE